MITPFDIMDELKALKLARAQDIRTLGLELADASFRRDRTKLLEEVLREIANGSIDPRSLARAVLEIKDDS